MASFDPRCVVQILDEQGHAIGSGYELGNGRVLTAQHVVRTRPRVGIGPAGSRTLEVCWIGPTPEADLAVLAPAGEVEPLAPPKVALFLGDPLGKPWKAAGFPALVGESMPFSGNIEPAQDPNEHCVISATVFPPEAEDWRGMSGSAVFVADRLWGILRGASGYVVGRALRAVPLRPFLDEGLREAIGLPLVFEQRHTRAVNAIVEELRASTLNRLISAHHAWGTEGCDSKAVAAAILDIQPPSALAKIFKSIFEGLKTEQDTGHDRRELATSILKVFEWAMPHASGYHHHVSSMDENDCLALKTRHVLNVEPTDAWYAGRAMAMTMNPKPRPIGYLEIKPRAGTPNGGIKVSDQVELVLADFAEQLGELTMTWFTKHDLGDDYGDFSLKDQLEALDDEMKLRAPSTYFTLIADIQKVGGRQLVQYLRDHVPAMRVVLSALQDTDSRDLRREDNAARGAIDIIYRSYHAILGLGGQS